MRGGNANEITLARATRVTDIGETSSQYHCRPGSQLSRALHRCVDMIWSSRHKYGVGYFRQIVEAGIALHTENIAAAGVYGVDAAREAQPTEVAQDFGFCGALVACTYDRQ